MGNMASPSRTMATTTTTTTSTRGLCLLSLLAILGGVAHAQDLRIAPMPTVPSWQHSSLMHLQLTAPESEAEDLTYDVYPLTIQAGLNQTGRNEIWIRGSLVPAEVLDADRLRRLETIAFLSCDGENATNEVKRAMDQRPTAILLYSVGENCCGLEGNPDYTALYTMADSSEALDTLNYTIRAGGILRATITGSVNMTEPQQGPQNQQGGESAIAMSILYSITGLITLLFLVIIGMGAIKAHRYPDRYGPRAAYGGRPPQSRARGLARAVLETLPIVKFGDPTPAKPDPALELESQPSTAETATVTTTTRIQDPTMGTRLSAIPEEPRTPQTATRDSAPMSGAVPSSQAAPVKDQTTASGGAAENGGNSGAQVEGDAAVCSICTEDFTVGEDVRVLPCDHKFHPPCIDPWLINVSGTCPLCRLDLNPRSSDDSINSDLERPFPYHPPPSIWAGGESRDGNGNTSSSSSNNNNNNPSSEREQRQQRRRSSRFFELTQTLLHASVEERIEALRRHRSQQQLRESVAAAGTGAGTTSEAGEGTTTATTATTAQRETMTGGGGGGGGGESQGGETAEEQRRRRTRLADRLRERFHVRTRPHPPPPSGDGGR